MTILCYHSVDPVWRSPLAVTPGTFERHISWLLRHRTPVDLPTAAARVNAAGRLPRGMVTVTFDDGLSGVYDHALPLLRRLGVPATVFVVAQTLATQPRAVDWVDTPPPWPLTTLSGEQLLELEDSGVRIESHSAAHVDLRTLGAVACEQDLRSSRELLEDLLHRPVRHLAYPRGRHDPVVRQAAERSGFTYAYSLPEGREQVGSFSIPRVGVYPQNGTRALRMKTTPGYLHVRTSRAYRAGPIAVKKELARARTAS